MARCFWMSVLGVGLLLSVGAGPSWGQTEAIATAKHDLKLGFPIDGRVQEVHVEMGDAVQQGQVLATLEDRQGESLIELWALRAESDVQTRLQAKQLKMAERKAEVLGELHEKNAAASFEAERAALEAEMEMIALEQAYQNFREAQIQLAQAKERHEHYVLRAPRDGVIERVEIDEGETVEKLQPIIRLVQTDELRIDASVPLEQTLELEVGGPAWVTFQVGEYKYEPVEGKIVHLAAVQDAASNTRRTRIEVPNPAGLPAGLHVRVYFTPPTAQGGEVEGDDVARGDAM